LIRKEVGGQDFTGANSYQKVDYKYNIRGWLKEINDVDASSNADNDLFAFKINYNEGTTPLYNGNISETYWKSESDNVLRKYEYHYDNLNRLLLANYSKPLSTTIPSTFTTNSYLEKIGYDKNGNILSLVRNGDLDSNDFAIEIDNLDYTYDTNNKNLLKKVLDRSNHPQGFKDDSNGITDPVDDYEYDVYGNLIKDTNKEITNITYNHLNLPSKITFANGNFIQYIYNALGQKVQKKVIELTTMPKNINYMLGGYQYTNDVLNFFPHAEGYVNVTFGRKGAIVYNYVYQYKDHLGNNRLSYTVDPSYGDLTILEENHYYPFGLKHTSYNTTKYEFVEVEDGANYFINIEQLPDGYSSAYKYKYNGKEYQDELGLNMYDYGARNYMADLGRYFNMDNYSEAFYNVNPYQYVANNPVKFIDVNGEYIYIYNDDNERLKFDNGKLYSRNSDNEWVEYNAKEGSYAALILDALNSLTNNDENSFGSMFLSFFSNDATNAFFIENKKEDKNLTIYERIFTSTKQKSASNVELVFHITIGHELAHVFAYKKFNNDVLNKKWFSITKPNGKTQDVTQDEIFAVIVENMFRSEQSLPLRTHYSVDEEGSVIKDSEVIKKMKIQNGLNTQYEPTEQALKIWNEILNSRK